MGNKIRIKQIDLQGVFSASAQVNLLSASNYVSFVSELNTTMSSDAELTAVSSSISQSIYNLSQLLGSYNGLVSGSSQLTSSYDTRYVLSGSITQTTWDNIENKPSNIISSSEQLPNGLISSSAQIEGFETTGRGILSGSISYEDLTNIPAGIVSQSTDITSLNAFTASYFTNSSSFDSRITTEKGRIDAILSASTANTDTFAEIVTLINSVDTTNDNAFATYYTSSNARISSLENATSSYETTGRGILSGSIIDLLPSGVISGSSQVLDGSGIYSSSAQIEGFETTGRGILSGSISYTSLTNIPTNIVSSSSQLTSSFDTRYTLSGSVPAGTISSSAQLPSGLVSGSSQLTASYDTRYTLSGSVQNVALPDGLISSSTQISDYGFISSSHTDITSLNAFTSSYYTTSASFDSRISSLVSAGVPAGTVSGSSQLTSSYDSRYVLSGSVQSLPDGIISSSAQIDTLFNLDGIISSSAQISGFETIGRNIISSSAQITNLGFISSSADITSLNTFTSSYYVNSSSFDTRISTLVNNTGSYETTGRGIISESVVTISGTTPSVGVGNLWYDNNVGNLYLKYDTNTWVDTSNGVIQTIISDGSLLSTASFNAWTASYTASVPNGTISGSSQITSFGFVSGSYETTGRGIISSSAQLSSLGYVTSGGNVAFNSVTANQYIVSSSVYYVTQSYSSGSTIFGNTTDDTHQFTGSVSISGSLTASLSNGYMWVGNGVNRSYEFPTASLLSTASFNTWTGSAFNSLSSSLNSLSQSANTTDVQVSSSIATLQASLGATSTAFNFTNVVNPTNFVLVSYLTASFNGGVIDILGVNNSNGTATSTNYQFASYGSNTGISQNGKQTSGAGAPNLAPTMIVSGSYINIVVTLSGTYNLKGVARLF